MPRFKYTINLTYLPSGDASKAIYIPTENVRKLFIDHNYSESNMPVMYCTLNIDKTLFDKIVLGAKTDSIVLCLKKFDADSKTPTKIMIYNSVCEYFLNHDINYNKDIDYKMKPANDKEPEKKDVYREVSIGLMFKDCIERNKQTNNMVIKDSTMMNIVGAVVKGQPALVEPFTYNDKFDQLIIPPQPSLTKAIAFLNDTKVFYDTQYRLFFEPECVYIVSSSGIPTPKRSDKYDTVRFIVYKPNDMRASALGESEDPASKSYIININANDTNFRVDADIAKQFSNISAIINPSKSNSLSALSSMQKIANDIGQIAGGIMQVAKDSVKTLENIPSSMSKMKFQFVIMSNDSKGAASKAISAIDNAKSLIQAMPEPTASSSGSGSSSSSAPSSPTLSKAQKDAAIKKLNEFKTIINAKNTNYQGIYSNYQKSMSSILGTMGKVTNMPGLICGVSPVNAQQNIPALKNNIKDISSESASQSAFCTDVLHPYVGVMTDAQSACTNAISIINSTKVGSTSNSSSGSGSSNPNAAKVAECISALNEASQVFGTISHKTGVNLALHASFPTQFNGIDTNFKPFVQKLDNVGINLKAQFTTMKQDIAVLGQNAKSMLKQIQSAGDDALNVLKSGNLSLSSLNQLKNDINAVKDIANIGKLGISKLDFKLNLGRINGTGTTIYTIKNDNPNKLKNIKNELETKQNTIVLNKSDIDISTININMKYLIKNFDAHSDKNGIFLLDRRMDIFIRQDDTFNCNCQMRFRLIPDKSHGQEAEEGVGKGTSSSKTLDASSIANEITHALENPTVLQMVSKNPTLKALSDMAVKYSKTTSGKGSNSSAAKEIMQRTILR